MSTNRLLFSLIYAFKSYLVFYVDFEKNCWIKINYSLRILVRVEVIDFLFINLTTWGHEKNEIFIYCTSYRSRDRYYSIYTYNQAWGYTTDNYGNGVPSDSAKVFVNHFYPNAQQPATLDSSNINNTIIVIYGLHAAIYKGTSNGTVYYLDPETKKEHFTRLPITDSYKIR